MLERIFALFHAAEAQVNEVYSFSCSLELFTDGSGSMTYGRGQDDVTGWDDLEGAVAALEFFLVQFPKQAAYPTFKEETAA